MGLRRASTRSNNSKAQAVKMRAIRSFFFHFILSLERILKKLNADLFLNTKWSGSARELRFDDGKIAVSESGAFNFFQRCNKPQFVLC